MVGIPEKHGKPTKSIRHHQICLPTNFRQLQNWQSGNMLVKNKKKVVIAINTSCVFYVSFHLREQEKMKSVALRYYRPEGQVVQSWVKITQG